MGGTIQAVLKDLKEDAARESREWTRRKADIRQHRRAPPMLL